jgi:hypothetical protein
MDDRTGQIYTPEQMEILKGLVPSEEKTSLLSHLVEVKRSLTEIEEAKKQIELYAPCGCGSGKKFKFCCYKLGQFKQARS